MKLAAPLLVTLAVALLHTATAADTPAPVATATPEQTPPPPLPAPLTPPAGPAPRINGAKIFGVRSSAPFLYSIPATGDRPMNFAAQGLPAGLELDAATGRITGVLKTPGEFKTTLTARNAHGSAALPFRIIVGDEIALTPPMGWNSWNCWGGGIDQSKIARTAHAMVKFGLDQHGWTYVNIDDGWQGTRGGPLNAIQPDPKRFPDMAALATEIHGLGLKLGIYSTPWVTSYARHIGGSSENPQGTWDGATMTKGVLNKKSLPFAIGQYHFFTNDAKQWAAWGVDYLKFDWYPNEVPETREMYEALRSAGRDVVYSLSNQTNTQLVEGLSKYANSWRTGGDITDNWGSIKSHGFGQDKWLPYARPGHWNDPDMFEVGFGGSGKPKRLTPDEQYTHVSMWCLASAPLLLGCDLEKLDPFTIGLLTNDEVLALDQDALGKQASRLSSQQDLDVYGKTLEDGSWAVGLFNRGEAEAPVTVKWSDLKLSGRRTVRDLWRQKDLGAFDDHFTSPVPAHGVVLIRIFAP